MSPATPIARRPRRLYAKVVVTKVARNKPNRRAPFEPASQAGLEPGNVDQTSHPPAGGTRSGQGEGASSKNTRLADTSSPTPTTFGGSSLTRGEFPSATRHSTHSRKQLDASETISTVHPKTGTEGATPNPVPDPLLVQGARNLTKNEGDVTPDRMPIGYAWVDVAVQPGCAACEAGTGCGADRVLVRQPRRELFLAANTEHLEPGDTGWLSITRCGLTLGSGLLFGFPLFGFFLGALTGQSIIAWFVDPVADSVLREVAVAVGAFGGVAIGCAGARAISSYPAITRQLEPILSRGKSQQ